MCDTLLIPCNKNHTTVDTPLLNTIAFTWKATKFTYRRTVEFTVGLYVITVALYRATRWTVRTIHRAYRWWATLPVNRGQRQPVAAITDKPADKHTAMTLADLRLKEPANR